MTEMGVDLFAVNKTIISSAKQPQYIVVEQKTGNNIQWRNRHD